MNHSSNESLSKLDLKMILSQILQKTSWLRLCVLLMICRDMLESQGDILSRSLTYGRDYNAI